MDKEKPLFTKPIFIVAAIILAALIIIGCYYLFSREENSRILEISFISDHPVNENNLTPSYIGIFADVFEEKNKKPYISQLSFKRTDVDVKMDLISFTQPIDANLSISDAKKIFANERSSLPATLSMGLSSSGLHKNLHQDTKFVTHFYLDQSITSPDNIKHFNDALVLKNHIQRRINNNELFPPGHKPNRISIILQSATVGETTDDVSTKKPKKNERVKTTPTSRTATPKIKTHNATISISGNRISWNSNLANAQELRINFISKVDRKLLKSEDVSGLSSYYFNYPNSNYEASPIEIKIIGSFADGSRITNNTKTTTDLECH